MQQELLDNVNEYKKNNHKKNVWRRIVQGLACGVVFCTTYALILPAITMKQETFCGYEEHVHTQDCYVQDSLAAVLICPLEETEEEFDSNISGNDIIISKDGFGQIDITDPGQMPGLIPHKHTAKCYAIPTEHPLTCGLAEGEEHTHGPLCYGSWHLICEAQEHTHGLACFSNPNADVENAAVWEQMIASVALTGEWTEDVVSIAKNQVGYTESTLNYQVLEDGSLCGYNRYGAWSGAPYGEWNTMFANFCISYAGVESMPISADCQEWKAALENTGLYQSVQEDSPQAGELIFLDENADGLADRVGIVAEIIAATEEASAQIKSIQGDVNKQVQYVNYDLNDVKILGYGHLPKQSAPVYQYADAMVQVNVQLPEGTDVPRNAQLKVMPIGQENASYAELLQQAKDTVDGEVAGIRFYDISFYDKNDTYIPVKDWAQVTMKFGSDMIDSDNNPVILHYTENNSAPVVLDAFFTEEYNVVNATISTSTQTKNANNTIVSFRTQGFSVFAVVEMQTQGMYEAQVLKEHFDLIGRINQGHTVFMIVTNADIVDDSLDSDGDTRVALWAETVVVNEKDSPEDGTFEARNRVKGVEVVNVDYATVTDSDYYRGRVTGVADNRLLWRFESRSTIDETWDRDNSGGLNTGVRTFSIQSMATNRYLAINPDGTLTLSDTPYEFTSNALYGGFPGIQIVGNEGYLAFYDQTKRPNQENMHVFTTTMDRTNELDRSFALAEYVDPSQVDVVTNLDGVMAAIVAVNNVENTLDQLAAIASKQESDDALSGGNLWGSTGRLENGKLIIDNASDTSNNLTWEFEATAQPGTYYIKSGNYFGQPVNENAGKYINMTESRIFLSDTPQKFEIIRLTSTTGMVQDVVCLRTLIDNSYYYIQLSYNDNDLNIVSSGAQGDSSYSNLASHFVLVDIVNANGNTDATIVNELRSLIDQLPTREEFDAKVEAHSNVFATQNAYRLHLRQIAMQAKALYDSSWNSMSGTQQNFVGKTRIDKLLTDLEWLWRPDPDIVPAATPDVTVKLFNYTEKVNEVYFDGEKTQRLGFYSWDLNEKTIDENRQPTDGESWAPTMSPTLSAEGYPVITRIPVRVTDTDAQGNQTQRTEWQDVSNGELKYLFDDTYQIATMQNGGGLFRQDQSGYYYYFSDMNAASFNGSNFTLYDVVVRPEYTRLRHGTSNSDTNDSRSNFLPFDQVAGNIIYDDKALFGPNGDEFGDDEDFVTTRYDNNTSIETQTAYLNNRTDLWFGMTLDYNFFIPKDAKVVNDVTGEKEDMIFEFHGDDDVFVYIDDVLVLNIGGAHAARNGSINFTTGAVHYQTDLDENDDDIPEEGAEDVYTNLREIFAAALDAQEPGVDHTEQIEAIFDGATLADNTMHNLKFFYVERGGTYSYAGIKFNMPTIPENSLVVGKERTQDDQNEQVIDAQTKYAFRIVDATDTSRPYVSEGTRFIIYEDGKPVENATVGAGGIFTLKVNQRALFTGVLDTERADKTFIVQELIPTNIDGQYMVSYSDDMSPNNPIISPSTDGEMQVYSTYSYSVDGSNGRYTKNVLFTNQVVTGNLDKLMITKKAAEGTEIDSEEVFNIRVQVAGDKNSTLNPIPVGTKYTVNDVPLEVTTAGIIPLKVNETAVITGFLSGTYWTIEEIDCVKYGPTYYGKALFGKIEVSGNAGTFGLADTVEFTVTNHAELVPITIPISKQVLNNDTSHTFDFVAELGTWDGNSGTWSKIRDLHSGSITVADASENTGYIAVNLKSTDGGDNVYIKVWERNDGGNYIYDQTFYLLDFDVLEVDGELDVQINRVLKNGRDEVSVSDPLPFVNQKVSSFIVEKEVINVADLSDVDGVFSFEATITVNGSPYTEISAPDNGKYAVDSASGKVFFNLQHEESVEIPVPEGAVITVTETTTTGYSVSYQIAHGTQELSAAVSGATTGEITVGANGVRVHYINHTGYELPKTGSSTWGIYRVGGMLMLLAFAGLFFLRLRRKESQNT